MVQINATKFKWRSSSREATQKKNIVRVLLLSCILLFVCWSSQGGRHNEGSSGTEQGHGHGSAKGAAVSDEEEERGTKKPVFLGDLRHRDAGSLWKHLLQEAEAITKERQSQSHEKGANRDNKNRKEDRHPTLHVMEVGMHSARQCVKAAQRNLYAHCVEPSPLSFHRIDEGIKKQPDDVQKLVRFYQMAASDSSGLDLDFVSDGGTGDHVDLYGRNVDIWTMTKVDAPAAESSSPAVPLKKVKVKSVAIDDIIYNQIGPTIDYASATTSGSDSEATGTTKKKEDEQRNIDRLFLLKVDTQGHEPSVFSGLQKSIKEHKIDFVMTEYWPKGIDFMNNENMERDTECQKSVAFLRLLHDAGYTLYTMQVTSHPRAPMNGARLAIIEHNREGEIQTPTDDLMEHCTWFYDLERDPKYTRRDDGDEGEEYRMGYWTDVLAVSPEATLGERPVSASGITIARHLKKVPFSVQ